jgi:hypothetical protein
MSNTLRDKARRRGTKSKLAGDEPCNDELTAHLPKAKVKHRPFPLSKRAMRMRRKLKITKHADVAAY